MENFQTNWKSSDGLEIFAQGWKHESVAAKAIICLVHGIGEHTSRYLNVAKALTDEGFVLFGADMRGHGRSGGPRGHFPSIEAVLKDIDLLLEHARKLYRGLPLILYGHSLGGILVLYYALKQKPAIKGVISTSPGLHNAVEEQLIKVLAAKILGSIISSVSVRSELDVNALAHDPKVIKQYINDPLAHDKISLGLGKMVLNLTNWTLEHAREFPLPLLLMHGKADSIAYPSSSIEFAATLDDRCKLVLWEDAYHELHNEPIKEELFKTMTLWIKNLLSE